MNTNLNQTEDQLILYWVHLPEHTEEHLQGYIGVTNDLEERMRSHRRKAPNKYFQHAINKYGWDNLVKEVIVRGPESDILELEQMFRPKEKIGWNLAIGGGKPPSIKEYYDENPEARKAAAERTTAQFAVPGAREANRERIISWIAENPEAHAEAQRKATKVRQTDDYRKAAAERTTAQFAVPGAREAHSERTKSQFAVPGAREAHSEIAKAIFHSEPKHTCEHCGKSLAPSHYKQHHGDKCKHKNKD